jgi:hypothetical protein
MFSPMNVRFLQLASTITIDAKFLIARLLDFQPDPTRCLDARAPFALGLSTWLFGS